MTRRHGIASGSLICLLALAGADPLWTLWRIPDDSSAVKLKTGLRSDECEEGAASLHGFAGCYIEIKWDIKYMVCKPDRVRVQFRCRPDGEGLE
jgi:hypothetical protein